MQVASWLLVQRAVREFTVVPNLGFDLRGRARIGQLAVDDEFVEPRNEEDRKEGRRQHAAQHDEIRAAAEGLGEVVGEDDEDDEVHQRDEEEEEEIGSEHGVGPEVDNPIKSTCFPLPSQQNGFGPFAQQGRIWPPVVELLDVRPG